MQYHKAKEKFVLSDVKWTPFYENTSANRDTKNQTSFWAQRFFLHLEVEVTAFNAKCSWVQMQDFCVLDWVC